MELSHTVAMGGTGPNNNESFSIVMRSRTSLLETSGGL